MGSWDGRERTRPDVPTPKSGSGQAEAPPGLRAKRIHTGKHHFSRYRQPLQLRGWTKMQVRGCKHRWQQGSETCMYVASRVVQQTVVGGGQVGAYALIKVSKSFKKNMESEIHAYAHWVIGEQSGFGGVGPPVWCAHSWPVWPPTLEKTCHWGCLAKSLGTEERVNRRASRRRKWQPTPVFLPGESQGRGSLVGCRLWGRSELDTTEAT